MCLRVTARRAQVRVAIPRLRPRPRLQQPRQSSPGCHKLIGLRERLHSKRKLRTTKVHSTYFSPKSLDPTSSGKRTWTGNSRRFTLLHVRSSRSTTSLPLRGPDPAILCSHLQVASGRQGSFKNCQVQLRGLPAS